MSDQIVPLSNAPNQSLRTTLAIDGGSVTVQINVRFNRMGGFWVFSIFDSGGNPIVDSVPALCSAYPAGNLVPPALGIGAWYIVNASGVPMDFPDDTNLGTDFQLLVGDTPAL